MIFSSNQTHETPSVLARSFGAVLIFLATIVGISFNLLLLATILSKRDLRRNQINIFLSSLIVDTTLAICIAGTSVTFAFSFGRWHGPLLICKIIDLTILIFAGSIVWHYAFICLHRYLFLVYTSYRSSIQLNIRRKYIMFFLVASRFIPFITTLPLFIISDSSVYSQVKLRCEINHDKKFILTMILIVNSLLPCFMIIFCFIRTYMRIRSKRSKLLNKKTVIDSSDARIIIAKYQNTAIAHSASQLNNLKSKKILSNRIRQRRSINKMFALLILLLLLGFMPYRIMRLVFSNRDISPDLLVIVTVWYSLISPISPMVIVLVNTDIHEQFKILFNVMKNKVIKMC